MDAAAVFALLEKGLGLLPTLIGAGVDVYNIVENMRTVAAAGQDGSVTDDQITALESELDAAISDFNAELPPE